MSLLALLVILGSLIVGILAFAIIFEVYKRAKLISTIDICPPSEKAVQMVDLVCRGHFRMHILTNNATPFDDVKKLVGYEAYIRNPSVVAYIQNVKGGFEYE